MKWVKISLTPSTYVGARAEAEDLWARDRDGNHSGNKKIILHKN